VTFAFLAALAATSAVSRIAPQVIVSTIRDWPSGTVSASTSVGSSGIVTLIARAVSMVAASCFCFSGAVQTFVASGAGRSSTRSGARQA
jgi:hypothetical protein